MKTTWDGAPVSNELPHGTAVLVYRQMEGSLEFLVLHRSYEGPDHAGDWAWTPPSGARYPGEPVDDCAKRELQEETGLVLDMTRTDFGSAEWRVYLAEAHRDVEIRLSVEHDRWQWLPPEHAARICQPAVVGNPILAAAARLRNN